MARKSSFLQGFEVGSDLYNKGFSQAQSLAQMKLQADEKKYQRGRDTKADERWQQEFKLKQDAAEITRQRGTTAQQKAQLEIEALRDAKEERQKLTQQKKDDWALVRGAQLLINNADWSKPEDTLHLASITLPSLRSRIKTPDIGTHFDNWKEAKKDTLVMRQLKSLEDVRTIESTANGKHAEQVIGKKLKFGITSKDPEKVQSLLGNIELFGDAVGKEISQGGMDPTDDRITDFRQILAESGGNIHAFDDTIRDRHKPVLDAETERIEAKKVAEEKDARDLKAKQDLYDHENKDLSNNPTLINNMAFSGNPLTEYKTIYPSSTIRAVDRKRGEVKQGLRPSPGFPYGIYHGVDRIKASGVFTKELNQTESQSIGKAMRTLKQVEDLKWLTEKIQTGPVQDKLTGLHKLIDTEEGRDRAIFEAALNSIIPGLARGTYGEVGVLTDHDIENYKKTVASLGQQEAVNRILMEKTKKLIRYSLELELEGAVSNQKNVSGYVTQYIKATEGKTYDYPSEESFNDAKDAGKIPPGASISYPDGKGGTVTGTMPGTSTDPTDESALTGGSREEIESMVIEMRELGKVKAGAKVRVVDPESGKIIQLKVPSPQTSTPRLPDSPSPAIRPAGDTLPLQADPGYPSEPVPPSGVDGFGNTPMKPASEYGEPPRSTPQPDEELKPAELAPPASGGGNKLLPELEEGATGVPPLPKDEKVMAEDHAIWRAQLRTMAEKKGGTTNAAKMSRPFVGLNITGGSIRGVITAQDDPGVWIGKPGPEQRFLPWSEVIKLIDKDQIQSGNSAPEEHEGPDAVDEVIKSLGSKKDALMKVLGDEELRKKALEELRKRFKK